MSNFYKEKSNVSGLGTKVLSTFRRRSGLNLRVNKSFLKRDHLYSFKRVIGKKDTGKKLFERVQTSINFLMSIKCYKGSRHKLKYPTRGQRTHTNGKTRKKKLY